MQAYAQELLETLEADLEKIGRVGNALKRYDKSLELTEACIRKLSSYIKKHRFPDQQAEIRYFKTLAPPFYGKSFFFNKVIDHEVNKLSASKDDELWFIDVELREIKAFFAKEKHLIWYMNMNDNSMDQDFFLRGKRSFTRDELTLIIDRDLCPHSYRLAQAIGYTAFRSYLEYEKERLINPQPPVFAKFAHMKYAFAGTNADATELIKAFVKEKVIIVNGAPANGKQLGELFECVFVRNLGNLDDTHNSNMQRKKDPTPFLNRLIRTLLKKDE